MRGVSVQSAAICIICGQKQHVGRVLVKPLIVGIEFRHGDIKYTQFSYRSVTTTGFDENRIPWLYSVSFAIEFHFAFTFEDIIDFRKQLVIVSLCVFRNIDDVQRSRAIHVICKRPTRFATRAFYAG
jgi:hypothetical protein